MKALSISIALGLVVCGTWASAQVYYGDGGPYGEYHHASTAAEGAMRGMGAMARSAGEYNLKSSQAAINMTEAQKNYIQNRDEWTNTYFQMREANQQYRNAMRRPRASMDDMVRYAQAGKPKRVSPSDLDSVTGQINWPVLLQADQYAAQRKQLDKLFASRAAQGALGFEDQTKLRETTKAMLAQLKKQVREVPQMDYIAARRFIESLAFEGRVPTG